MSQRKQEKSKNDEAWEFLFDKLKILEEIHVNHFFEISSTQINTVRESRLMAKFDSLINLPDIFKKNKLSILPISRSKYVIGCFDTYQKVRYSDDVGIIPVEFPESIESIDYTHLYSECVALNCAFNTGMIDHIVGQKTSFTISGRMSTGKFEFGVGNKSSPNPYTIHVENSQCEIDGGFESDDYLLLVEAKNYSVDDFLIRQLYYPYRLWTSKISKEVIPVFMTYSNDIFSFFIYRFRNDLDYNSIELVEQRNYSIAPEQIQLDDVSEVFEKVRLTLEDEKIPFPQADKFERIVDLLSFLSDKELTKEEITQNYQFDARQTSYYTDACRYLGLVDKRLDSATNEITFCLTNKGNNLFKKKHKARVLALIGEILHHQVFYRSFKETLAAGDIPSKNTICEIMSQSNLKLSSTTKDRRSSSVRGWLEWIWKQID